MGLISSLANVNKNHKQMFKWAKSYKFTKILWTNGSWRSEIERENICLNVCHEPNPLVSEKHEIISVAENTPLQEALGQQRGHGPNRNTESGTMTQSWLRHCPGGCDSGNWHLALHSCAAQLLREAKLWNSQLNSSQAYPTLTKLYMFFSSKESKSLSLHEIALTNIQV